MSKFMSAVSRIVLPTLLAVAGCSSSATLAPERHDLQVGQACDTINQFCAAPAVCDRVAGGGTGGRCATLDSVRLDALATMDCGAVGVDHPTELHMLDLASFSKGTFKQIGQIARDQKLTPIVYANEVDPMIDPVGGYGSGGDDSVSSENLIGQSYDLYPKDQFNGTTWRFGLLSGAVEARAQWAQAMGTTYLPHATIEAPWQATNLNVGYTPNATIDVENYSRLTFPVPGQPPTLDTDDIVYRYIAVAISSTVMTLEVDGDDTTKACKIAKLIQYVEAVDPTSKANILARSFNLGDDARLRTFLKQAGATLKVGLEASFLATYPENAKRAAACTIDSLRSCAAYAHYVSDTYAAGQDGRKRNSQDIAAGKDPLFLAIMAEADTKPNK